MQPIRWILAAALLLTPLGCGVFPCAVPRCAAIFSEAIVVPAMDATNVPLNARVWVARPFSTQGEVVVSTGGSPIVGTTRTLMLPNSEQGVQQFVPKEPLTARTQYVITVAGERISSFTTGTESLTAPVAAVKATVIDRHIPQDQCDTASGTVQLEPPGVLSLVVLAGQESAFDPERGDGSVMLVSGSSTVTLGGCGSSWNGKDKVRFGTIDPVGRFSGWSELF